MAKNIHSSVIHSCSPALFLSLRRQQAISTTKVSKWGERQRAKKQLEITWENSEKYLPVNPIIFSIISNSFPTWIHRNVLFSTCSSCNHFASEFVKRLCNGRPPAYINRAAHSVCCLPFLDTMFSVKIETERLFVEVLYLTLNGDMISVLDVLHVNHQAHLPRYASYIEEAVGEHFIPRCLP